MASLPDFDTLPNADALPQGNAWGLWGKDDQLGTLNILKPDIVVDAAKEIKTGIHVQLDLRLDHFSTRIGKREPFQHHIVDFKERFRNELLGIFGHDDTVAFNTQSSSQWDGLRHVGFQQSGTYYNGLDHRAIDRNEDGKLGIHKWVERGGIVGRGILLDYHRWRAETGQSPADPFTSWAMTVEELERVAQYQQLTIKPGDILVIRSGFMQRYDEASPTERAEKLAAGEFIGVENSLDAAKWLWNHHFSAVAGDSIGFECAPTPFGTENCLHEWLLGHWGCPIGELWDTEKLARLCVEQNRWSFFLTSAPLHVFGGVGSPPNVIAIL